MAGHYQDTVEDLVTGRPVNGATIKVYEDGATLSADGKSVASGTLATIYSDDGVTTIDQTNNPLTTGQDGEFDFYTNETRVVVAVLYNGTGLTVWNDQDILGGTVSSDVTALGNRLDNLDTLLGTTANDTDLGTFTGSIISDNTDLLAALQELETAIGASGSGDLLSTNNLSDVASASTARTNLGLAIGTDVEAYSAGAADLCPSFNFSADGEARFYAYEAMTLTQQATSGTGTIAYEKSTNAAPSTFSSTSSPISLESGAWLKVSATSVTDLVAVALKRTA